MGFRTPCPSHYHPKNFHWKLTTLMLKANENCQQCGGLGVIHIPHEKNQPCPTCFPTEEQREQFKKEVWERIKKSQSQLMHIDETNDLSPEEAERISKAMDEGWLESKRSNETGTRIMYIQGPPLSSSNLKRFFDRTESDALKAAGLPPSFMKHNDNDSNDKRSS